MTVTTWSFDNFMTVNPWRRARIFKPYFTYIVMRNMRHDIHPIVLHRAGYGNSIILCMVTHQSQWSSGFGWVGFYVWALKIWQLKTALAQIPYPTTLDSSDYNFGLKLQLRRFCIWQCNCNLFNVYIHIFLENIYNALHKPSFGMQLLRHGKFTKLLCRY